MMLDYKPGCLVKSLAGHDKERYFIILEQEGEYLTLADGHTKTVNHPKRKKKKHTQLVKVVEQESFPPRDEKIRKIIKRYKRSHCDI